MVDFSFISARFLGADDADEVFATPGVHDPIDLCIDPAECNKANLSVVFAVIDPLHDLVGKISAAVRNETRCLAKLALAFSSSHSNSSSTHHTACGYNTQLCIREDSRFWASWMRQIRAGNASCEKPQ